MESGRRNFIIGYDPLGWGEEPSWNQEEEILSWHTTLWGGGEHSWNEGEKCLTWDTTLQGGGGHHGIRKRKFYHGTRSFRVGGGRTFMESGRRNFIMGYNPLGWGGHSWNEGEEILSWDTNL